MKKTRLPTLSEVARQAGVGNTTVSRVINGGERVSPKTLARVRRVIEALGYRPNQAARVLKGDRTKTIGLIIPSMADPFFSSCAEAAQAVARANDSLLIVTATQNDPHTEIENLNILISHRVDGLLIAPANSRSQALCDLVNRLSIPIVAIDRPIFNSSVSSVVTDNFKGAQDGHPAPDRAWLRTDRLPYRREHTIHHPGAHSRLPRGGQLRGPELHAEHLH